jgi:4-amino-4-deoxy-L-arabinose transferase-like glycosyltransferase
MSLEALIERWSRGWRGPALAALIAFAAGLPGVFAVPPLDRDESRFAQATAQMLEQEDFVVIRYQDQPRFKKPVGIHWLQSASVAAFSDPAAREIWAYRIPSLLGAMLAAAACAWGAAAFFGSATGLIAGATLGATFLLSTEAFIAKTDAVLCGTTTLAIAALARIYASAQGGPPSGRLTRLLFWLGLSVATLDKGPVGLMVVALTALSLWAWDRKAGWLKDLGWAWGGLLFLAVVGPWAWAVTVATDGGFWSAAIGGDLAPKLAGGQESHGAAPGYHTIAAILLFFPATLILPAALVAAWRRRDEPGVRFALCWLVPSWLVFELMPTKLVHYTLPAYGALAWLAAATATQHQLGPRLRVAGAALATFAGVLLGVGAIYLYRQYGDPTDLPAAVLSAALLASAGIVGAVLLVRGPALTALTAALGLGLVGHGMLVAGLAPRLEPLWLSRRVEAILARERLLPRQGITAGPVAVAGYAEPSLVFGVGTTTDLEGPIEAADALADNRPAVVEAREQVAFEAALKTLNVRPRLVGQVSGLDYSNGDKTTLRIYAPPQESPP